MFWNIVIGLASFALNIILTPKPPDAKAAKLDDFSVPTAEEGIEIPVLFGTLPLKAPNVVWHGDLKVRSIKGSRRYGLFGPRQTIGHRYFLGMHMGLCHAAIDAIYKIKAGDKVAWNGICKGGRLTISKSKLFGGKDREGGISGDVDIELGLPDQVPNDYLVTAIGEAKVPGNRGITGAVLRGVYLGTTPYIKPWEFTTQRVYRHSDGTDQWNKEKAGIGDIYIEDTAVYFALDVSGSMLGERLATLKAAVAGALTALKDTKVTSLDICIVAWSDTTPTSIIKRKANADDYDAMVSWVNALTASGGTDFTKAVADADSFFEGSGSKQRVFVFVTDGLPEPTTTAAPAAATLAAIDDVKAFAFNIELDDTTYTELMDNTSEDGVPVVTGDDPESMQQALAFALSARIDINPAHIIRECLTDPLWAMGDNDSDIDSDSFTAAADTFFKEGFGLSILWQQESEIEDFIQNVQSHVDCYVYTSRQTGKWVIKPIRDDYDIDTIPIVDEDDVISWAEVVRRPTTEAINTVIVQYFDRSTGKTASHSVSNVAAVQQVGKVISTTRTYSGITRRDLAQRVGERDVKSLGTGMISGRIVCKRTVEKLNPGDPFRLVSTRHNLTGEVMRVVDIKFGDNGITIQFAQDVFSLSDKAIFSDGAFEPPVDDNTPVEPSPRLVWEMPYREARQMFGDSDLAAALASDPDAGFIQASAVRPATGGAINAEMDVDDGSGDYEFADMLEFAPGGMLDANVSASGTTITLSTGADLEDAETGILAAIIGASEAETEIIRIDGISGNDLTITRGYLDTVPRAHSAGAGVVFFDDISMTDSHPYTAADVASVKLLTVGSGGTLELDDATADVVDFDSRAIRPLRPANAKVNSIGFGTVDASALALIPTSWARRNRLTELDSPPGWTDADQTPETGQTTTVELTDLAGTSLHSYTGITGTSQDVDPADFGGEDAGYIKFYSVRDGYNSWTTYNIRVVLVAVEISGTPTTTAVKDVTYTSFTASAAHGIAPYVFSLVGAWPAGISIDASTGVVSGTPTESGSFTGLSVRVTDDAGMTDDLDTFTLTVASGVPTALLLSSIDELDPDENLLLSGDMTDGDDKLELSGDQR